MPSLPSGAARAWGNMMNIDMKRDAARKKFFDEHADSWDRNWPPEKLHRIEELVESLNIREGMTVIDVGCGQGILEPYLRKAVGPKGRIVAVDPSAPMLSHVPERDAETWQLLARAECMPLMPDWADMVICFSAFPHVEDKKAAAVEFRRVLKSGGQALILHIDGREKLDRMHGMHHGVHGDRLPCPHGMKMIFGEAGFRRMDAHEDENHYYFSAWKD